MAQTNEAGFEWLDNLHKKRQQCYTTCDWVNPAKSLDFGAEGYTASLTDWHELLQITSPDPTCGIVYVRGDFPDNPESILARSQRRDDLGNKGTFGLDVQPQGSDTPRPSTLERGDRIAHGLVNFRWPYSQYQLRHKNQVTEVGTCEELSWLRDHTVFQALRLKSTSRDRAFVNIRLGGKIRFGCPCANRPNIADEKGGNQEKLILHLTSDALQHSLVSYRYEKRLEIQLFIDGQGQGFQEPFNKSEPMSHFQELLLEPGKVRIIVATYRLVNDQPPISDQLGIRATFTDAPFDKIESDLGIAFDSIEMPDNLPFNSIKMTDRLWTACVPANYTAIQAREFCALARCVEQIMGVTSVPVASVPGAQAPASSGFGIALVNNILTAQYVDLQSTFWQIRYLVKAHEYLSKRKFGEEILKSKTSLDKIRDDYLKNIRDRIHEVLVWVLKADNTTGQLLLPIAQGHVELRNIRRSSCERMRNTVKRNKSYNQAYFQSLTVWYVMKHCRLAITTQFKSKVLLPELKKLVEDKERRKYEDGVSTAKSDILKWFRFRCLDKMCQQPLDEDGILLWNTELKLKDDIHKSEAECKKFVLRLRESREGPDSMIEEEIDRLYLLGEELFDFQTLAQDQSPDDLAQARAIEAQQRIESRTPTSHFNPGPKAGNDVARTPCHAPWELNSLNHHSALQAALWSKGLDDLGDRRDNVFQFILSDHTFMVTWDRAENSMIGKWWDMEPASVICATLIDLKTRRKLGTVESVDDNEASISRSSTGPLAKGHNKSDEQKPLAPSQTFPSPREQELMRRIEKLEMRLGFKIQHTGNRSFPWLSCKPAQCYHSKWQVQSLDVYEPVVRKLASRKKITKYIDEKEEEARARGIPTPTSKSSPKQIRKLILPEDMERMSACHLFLDDDSRFVPQTELVSDLSAATNHEKLTLNLDESLVDLGARHRIIFMERCTPSLVKGVVHLWHPDALDALDTYFGNISRFGETKEALWITNITISHWNMGNIEEHTSPRAFADDLDRFKEGKRRKQSEFPPLSVSKQKHIERKLLQERCLSLVITGDSSGHSWVCSLWCSITDSGQVEDYIKVSLPKLQHFIHQPSSGRCIFFIILLGHICERLAQNYRQILTHLDVIVELGEEVLLEGLDWAAEDTADKLKKHIWGLEAYRIIGDRLESSLVQIQRARQSVEHIVKQDAPNHHIDLVEEYNNVIEVFANQYNLLTGAQLRFKSKIIQLTLFRDGISTVSNVEDTKTTIKQGNNIRMLTLITIAYLPLSYVTSLFAVPQWALPRHEGLHLYLKYLFTFLIVTIATAFSLEFIFTRASKLKKRFWKEKSKDATVSNRIGPTRRPTNLSFV